MVGKANLLRTILAIATCATILSACASNRVDHSQYTGAIGPIASKNADVLAAKERKFQAEQQKIISSSELVPQVALTASATNHLADNLSPVARSSEHKFGAGVTWPILKSVAAIRGVQAAQSNILAADAAVRAQENQLLVDIATAVASFNRAAQVAVYRSDRLARLQNYLAQQTRRSRLGEVSKTELQQIKGRIAAARGALETANAERASATAQLTALGLGLDHAITLATPEEHLPGSEQELIALVRRDNPAELEGRHRIQAAKDSVDQSALGLLPELNLNLTADQSATTYANNSTVTTDNAALRLDLSVPLFDGGRRRAQLAQEQSRMRELVYQNHSARVNMDANARSTWFRFNAARQSQSYAAARISSANKALAGVREARRVGARSISDELNAMDEVTEARVSAANASYDRLVYGHQLMAQIDRIANAYKLTASR